MGTKQLVIGIIKQSPIGSKQQEKGNLQYIIDNWTDQSVCTVYSMEFLDRLK